MIKLQLQKAQHAAIQIIVISPFIIPFNIWTELLLHEILQIKIPNLPKQYSLRF